MNQHNEDIFKLIRLKRNELSALVAQSLDGQQKYKELLALYALLDAGTDAIDSSPQIGENES